MLSTRLNRHIVENPRIKLVYDTANRAYRGHLLPNGDSLLERALAMAEAMLDWGVGDAVLMSALLHGLPLVASDGLKRIADIAGEEVALLVRLSLEIDRLRFRQIEANIPVVQKFIAQFSGDIRVLLLVVTRRLYDARFLYTIFPTERAIIAMENMRVYSPLAYLIGLRELSGEIADLSFPHLYPQEHQWLTENLQDSYEEREKYTTFLVSVLGPALRAGGIKDFRFEHRAKRHVSLYRKLVYRYNMALDRVGDLVGLRIVVPRVNDCYAALGIIHDLWTPVPGYIKDYIAYPKPNGYRSLHTTLFAETERKQLLEIQIRTEEMHYHAEYGPAADYAYHFRYSGHVATDFTRTDEIFDGAILEQLQHWRKALASGVSPRLACALNLFADRIFVFTPKRDLIELAKGATALDLAYRIHTDIGHRADYAIIKGSRAPLQATLRSGDVVEILLHAERVPVFSSLGWAKTKSARGKIRAALRSVADYFHHSG